MRDIPGIGPSTAGYIKEILDTGKCSKQEDWEKSVPFSVDFPACPTVPVAATIPCQGWVKQGSVCPSSTPGQSCTCAASGQWECP